jgi:hypothetical protein
LTRYHLLILYQKDPVFTRSQFSSKSIPFCLVSILAYSVVLMKSLLTSYRN